MQFPSHDEESHGGSGGEGDVGTQSHEGSDAPICVTDPAVEYHLLLIYARPSNGANRYTDLVDDVRRFVDESNAIINDEAASLGGTAQLRVRCTGGVTEVRNEVLPTLSNADSFDTITQDLRTLGYTSTRDKYWVYYDDGVGGFCGQGNILWDDSLALNNLNNAGSATQVSFAITYGCLDSHVMLHELGHILGVVQLTSPNTSGGWHCNDGQDIMCYDDGGGSSNYDPNVCPGEEQWDCNNDDYFHPNPPGGNYLVNHWNLGHQHNRYIQRGAANEAPNMQSLSCTPSSAATGQAVTCAFRASDDSPELHYTVNWGDGSPTTRVPAAGTVVPGVDQAAGHAWSSTGTYTVSVTARDYGSPQKTSTPRTTQVTINQANQAPTMQSLSCSPNPSVQSQTVTCNFHANDDSTGVFYTVSWGDGSSNTRVPSAGTVAPGFQQSATHAWTGTGSFTVSATATDNGNPALSSTARTTGQTVNSANAAPTMDSLSCSPNPSQTQESVACTYTASDDSTGVYYTVAWGDGSPDSRVPPTGTVAPGSARTASHTWSAANNYPVTVTATDNANPPLTSGPRTVTQTVVAPNQTPSMFALACSPDPAQVSQTVTCEFYALDDSTGVSYTVDWGDGSPTTRVPASGTTSPGSYVSAQHAWTSSGSYTVSVTATDNANPALSSAPRTEVQNVQLTQDPNDAPVMQDVYCTPDPSNEETDAACYFYAADDSAGVFYEVTWGDGSPTTRVPTSGLTVPGNYAQATHAWATSGAYTVSARATDNGVPALTSGPDTWTQDVVHVNLRPVIQSFSCSPNPSAVGDSASCTFQASDDSAGVAYIVEWGDGSADTRVPASGFVAPGAAQSAPHAWASAASFFLRVSATDDDATSPQTSDAVEISQTVQTPTNAAPVVTLFSCNPNPSLVDSAVTCSLRAQDDSPGVSFDVDWGDGSVSTRVPSSGFAAPGTTLTAEHTWTQAASFTLSLLATDNGNPQRTSDVATLVQGIQHPPCFLLRSGSLLAGLAGLEVESITVRDEGGLPAACAGKVFHLTGSFASDFNVCWFAGSVELSCHNATFADSGVIPAGADRARIIYFAGVNGSYTLSAA